MTSANRPDFFSASTKAVPTWAADRLAFQIVLRGVGLGIALWNHEAFPVSVDRIGEVDDLLARRGNEHRCRDDVDLAGGQRRDQRRERHRLDLHVEAGILADLGDEIDHDALDGVGLGVEEGEGNACRRRTNLQHLLRRSRRCCGNRECRDRGLDKTLQRHRIPLWARPMAALADVVIADIAGRAVSAYFHQYENLVTLSRVMQAVFMNMKEAV
ncbi:hypothetical protein ACVWWO_003079 [Bradyrhizobium sp. F1.13.1]